jgi:hypothetical protein
MSYKAEFCSEMLYNPDGAMRFRLLRLVCAATVLAAVASVPGVAQSKEAVKAPEITPKVEIFAGYSYLYPNATATGYLPNGIVPVSSCLCAIPAGGGASVTYDFNHWLGLTLDASAHVDHQSGTPAQRIGNADAYNISVGPQFKLRRRRFSPFAEVLVGGDRLAPSVFHQNDSFGMVAGGGLDATLGRHFALRLVQADFVYANHHFAPSPVISTQEHGLRLQAGVVFAFGGGPVVAPAPVLPVVPAPAPVIVAPVEVLTLTATANPGTVIAGDSSTISAHAVSSLGRPLTFSYQSTLGTIQGANATEVLTTLGAFPGTAIVTVSVFDDMNQTAVTTVPVILTAPAVPVPVVTSALCTMSFVRDARRPGRVDNEAKACLDEIALDMQRNSEARLALIGSVALQEHHRDQLAADRAAHAKAYLVSEKGIDANRIDVYSGTSDSKSVSSVLIPAGASLDTTGLTPVDATH